MGKLVVHAVRSYPSGTVVCSDSDFRSTVNLLGCICLLVLNEWFISPPFDCVKLSVDGGGAWGFRHSSL